MLVRVSYNPMYGRLTAVGDNAFHFSYEDAMPQWSSNHWCVTENNRNNARNVNFNNGNTNNNNKYNSNVVRPVAAYVDYVPKDFMDSVSEAIEDCLKHKRRSSGAVEYLLQCNEDLPKLAYEMWTLAYKPGTSVCFLVKYPKLREVFAASFRDRIVHHWVCIRLEPLFEQRFVEQDNVSFNCRKGFGTGKAVEYVSLKMAEISNHYHTPAWVFKGDLCSFFMSIDKNLLWYRLERFIKRKYHGDDKGRLLTLTHTIVMHHPEKDCILNSKPEEWLGLDLSKSLFTCETGEPIGNLTTQLFANFFMSFFVIYVKFLFRRVVYFFAQFVDDFVIGCVDLRFLVASVPKLEHFLKNSMHLSLHPNKRSLQPVSHGLLFVGAYIKPGRIYLSNRTLARMMEHCYGYGIKLHEDDLTEITLQHIEQVLNSYFGFTKERQTHRFRQESVEALGADFWRYFVVRGHYENVRLKDKYRIPNCKSYEETVF